jgi:hypothetical protein
LAGLVQSTCLGEAFAKPEGVSDFETAGLACHAVGVIEDFKRAKTPLWAKRCRLWMGTF